MVDLDLSQITYCCQYFPVFLLLFFDFLHINEPNQSPQYYKHDDLAYGVPAAVYRLTFGQNKLLSFF